MSPADDWLDKLCRPVPMPADKAIEDWKAGRFTVSTFWEGLEISQYWPDIFAARDAVEKVTGGRDRFLTISTGPVSVDIFIGHRETLLEALRQCAVDLSDPDTCFNEQAEEELARRAVPLLLAQLERGPACQG